METLREIRRFDSDLPVIMISGVSSPVNVVEAVKSGATDFLGKPVNHEDLRNAVAKALEARPAVTSEVPQTAASSAPKQSTLFGSSPRMKDLLSVVTQIAWSEAPVLIQGETGAGKEALARQLHALSPRGKKPLLKLNCAALPSELVESELFGYERGAFTGAFQKKLGMFELADGGTILLDEIGDMDFKLQAKLLQVLQDHEFQRLGGKEMVHVDVRVIAATHTDLEQAIIEDRFREDLYYRLNVITLHVPALRERQEDILALTDFLMRRHARPNTPVISLTPGLRQALLTYDWPGNVRELENVVRRLLVLGNPDAIARELQCKPSRNALFPAADCKSAQPPHSSEPVGVSAPILEQVTRAKQQAETEAILAALTTTRWNRKKAAALLKIDYKALLYKMKKLQIDEKIVSLPPEQPQHSQCAFPEHAASASGGGAR